MRLKPPGFPGVSPPFLPPTTGQTTSPHAMRCVGALLALLQLASDASAERLATVSWDRRLAEGDELQVIRGCGEVWMDMMDMMDVIVNSIIYSD